MADWIRAYRESVGLTEAEFAAGLRAMQKRRKAVGLISVALVRELEWRKDAVTHPHFANVIAEACGASADQRDMIVPEKYRGRWKPPKKPQLLTEYRHPWKATPAVLPKRPPTNQPTAVVAVDRDGRVVARYASIMDVERAWPITNTTVANRCHRGAMCDEFEKCGVTFRFADDWARMTPQERAREMERAASRSRK